MNRRRARRFLRARFDDLGEVLGAVLGSGCFFSTDRDSLHPPLNRVDRFC
jgi:hypothetical protein